MALRLLGRHQSEEARAAWQALESRVPDAGLMCSWTWTSTWLEVWGETVEHWFALVEREDRPAGIALLTCRPGGRLRPTTVHVGTAGEPRGESIYVEANRLLAEPDAREELAAGVAQAIAQLPRAGAPALDGFVPADAELLARHTGLELRTDPAPYARLEGDVLDSLRSGVRRRVRQSMRAYGELETEWADTPEAASAILEELMALHRARWEPEGIPGAFAAPRTAAFHRAVVPRLAAEGRCMLFRARAAGETIGCLYGHVDGGELLFYQSGFAPAADNKRRPGLVTHVLAMQACADRGLTTYDFLAGADRYKTELAGAERAYAWASPRPGLALRAAKRLRAVLRDRG